MALAWPASAAPESVQPESAILRKASEALRQGNLSQAQELLQTAFQKNYEPRVLCLMGQLAKARGRAVQAYDFYHRCLEESGGAVDPSLQQEATTVNARPPGQTGEIFGLSKKVGFLWVADVLTARIRPGEPARIVLPAGKQSLHLGVGAAAFEVTVQPQNVCDVDLDQQQSTCSTKVLLLPFGPKAPIALDRPALTSWWSRFATSLRKENGRLVELPRQQALFRQSPKVVDCLMELPCQIQLGKLADATYVLGLQLDLTPSFLPDAPKQDYKLRAWLMETRVEKSTGEKQEVCQRCSLPELEQTMEALVRQTFSSGQRAVRLVQISSTPIATVVIDGTARGPTPLQLWRFPGTYEVKLQQPYFYPLTERIEVLEDTTDEIQKFPLTLRPLPISRGERAIHYGAWLAGGLSLATIAAGIGLYVKPDVPMFPMDLQQPGYFFSTKNPGIVMLATGGALLLTSVILFVVDHHSQAQRRTRLTKNEGSPAVR